MKTKYLTIYEDIKVYDYGYKIFHKLRDLDGITSEMINESFDIDLNIQSCKDAGESTGKSGSFFFFSYDRRFIIKTMFQEELELFLEHIVDYLKHLEENPDSLLARYYGVYQI